MAARQTSKYRHAFCDEPKKPDLKFSDLPKPFTSSDSGFVAASTKWLAMAKNGAGGPVVIRSLDGNKGLGRMKANAPVVNTHRGKVVDLCFNNFVPDMLITGSDDLTIHGVLLQASDDASSGDLKAPIPSGGELFSLEGHEKKICQVRSHPTADNILASCSFDRTLKVWDISTQECLYTNTAHTENIYSLEWNKDGSQCATTCKDKKMRIFDPRSEGMNEIAAFESGKCSKVFWVPREGWIGATGFTKQAKRCIKMWDLRNDSAPVHSQILDNASSVLYPTFDDEIGILWMWGKGDGTLTFAEIAPGSKPFKPLGVHRSATPAKGGCFIPKAGLDTLKCEVARFMKLTINPSQIVPLSFVVPRKATDFQADLYPDAYAGVSAMTAAEYQAGENRDPVTTSMDPQTLATLGGAVFVPKKTYHELEEENEQLKARVAELEAQLGITHEEEQAEN